MSRDVLLRLLDQLALEDVGCSPMAEAVKGQCADATLPSPCLAFADLVGLDAGYLKDCVGNRPRKPATITRYIFRSELLPPCWLRVRKATAQPKGLRPADWRIFMNLDQT